MTISLSYNDDLSRVQISLSSLTADRVRIERSLQGTLWDIVRGGRSLAVESGSASLDDFEFYADVETEYRVIDVDTGSTVETDEITVDLSGEIWLKSIRYPLLNRTIQDLDRNEAVERPSRSTAHGISGRSAPVAVHDLTGSRRFTLTFRTTSDHVDSAAALDLMLHAGATMFLHVPADSGLPGGYILTDGPSMQRLHRGSTDAPRVFDVDCINVAPPGPDVVGTTLTWRTVRRLYGDSWAATVAAHPTLASLLALVGDEDDLVVI